LIGMTTPGEPGEKPPAGDNATPSEGAYEAPPIEQTPGQPTYQPPPAYTPPPSYPPPGAPPPGASYPPPSSYPGGYSGGYPQPSKTNQMAIWSLVASLIGIVCGIGSFVGIVLGIIALNQIKQTREGGYGLAVAGIVVGVVSLIISILWYAFAFSH
jgi:Domain of unknown function (DUF4190)